MISIARIFGAPVIDPQGCSAVIRPDSAGGSTRSPTTLKPASAITLGTSHTKPPPCHRWEYRLRLQSAGAICRSKKIHSAASSSTPAMPPNTPSQLLLGLIDGASLRATSWPPNARPAK